MGALVFRRRVRFLCLGLTELGLGLRDRVPEGDRIEPPQHLSPPDVLAFGGENLRDVWKE